MNKSKKFVLTGGPGTGKTTLINILHDQGYQTTPEVYTLLYEQAKKNNTLHEFLTDRVLQRQLLMAKQIELESQLDPHKIAFLDRGTYDVIFFALYNQVQLPQKLLDEPKKHHYTAAFFIEPLPEKYYHTTQVRRETHAQMLAIHQSLKEHYKKTSIPILEVPFDTPDNRVKFILNTIKSTSQQAARN